VVLVHVCSCAFHELVVESNGISCSFNSS